TYEVCASDAECTSGVCTPVGTMSRCTIPCCSSKECDQVPEGPVACTRIMHGGLALDACALLTPPGATGVVGDPCSRDSQCLSAHCAKVGFGGFCTDVCCTDDSCGDTAKFACRAVEDSGFWPLRCEPK